MALATTTTNRNQIKAVSIITGGDTTTVRGTLSFVQDGQFTQIKGKITGLTPGLHAFHIHALGDTTNGCISTGPHFNPLSKPHGAPSDTNRHAGDLGNIIAGPDGVAEVSVKDSQIPLSGQHSILGRAVVVHADPDDLGRGGHELSKTTGNAGARIGCEQGDQKAYIWCMSRGGSLLGSCLARHLVYLLVITIQYLPIFRGIVGLQSSV